MKKCISVFCVLLAGAIARGQDSGLVLKDAKEAWTTISGAVVRAAEKVPGGDYTFRPTASVRSFGEIAGHLVDANYMFCSALAPEKKSPPDAEHKLKSKTELVSALKESVAYCNAAFGQVSEPSKTVKLFGRDWASVTAIYAVIAHESEHYGNMATYLRLKGIVPPTSEGMPPAAN